MASSFVLWGFQPVSMGEGTFQAVHILRYKIGVQLQFGFAIQSGMEHAVRLTNVQDSVLLHLNDATAISGGSAISN
jgi:hypothetical protein